MSLTSYLVLGLATSVHCVAMCGGLVLTYAVNEESGGGLAARIRPHLAYQGAKIVSYMLVALALGTIATLAGSAFDITGIRNWIMVFAGAYMILLGLGMTGAFPGLHYLTPRPPKALVSALSKNRHKALEERSEGSSPVATPIVFGLLTGLMPCAPLMAAQAGALSAPTPAGGALLMLAFGLGTAPLMLVFGVAASALSGAFKRKMLFIAALVVVVFGLVILNRGAMLVGSPVTAQSVVASVTGVGAEQGTAEVGVDGFVEVSLTIKNTTFIPDTVRVPAGVPVRLLIDRQEDNACSDQVALPQLGVLEDVAPFAVTTVEVPAAEAGTYTLTCGMGMMPGRYIVGESSGDLRPLWMFLVGLGVSGIALYAMRRRPRAIVGNGERRTLLQALGLSEVELVLIIVAIALAIVAGLIAGNIAR